MSRKNDLNDRESSKTRGPKSGTKQVSAGELPRKTLEECLEVIRPIHEIYAGATASWDEIASAMGVGAKSNNTKYLIWSAQAYELITKDGEKFSLSETGRKLLAPNYPEEKSEAALKSIRIPTIPSKFYSDYDGKLIPPDAYLDNVLENRYSVPRNRIEEAKKIILANAEYAGIVTTHSDDKRTIRLEAGVAPPHPVGLAQEVNDKTSVEDDHAEIEESVFEDAEEAGQITAIEAGQACFYITPIGDDGTDERKHADMLLRHLIEPVFNEFNVTVIRADKIGRSGLISKQIFEYIVSSKFCVADLSFGNPNAFYELGVRHMTKLPTIQIIRKGDKIPFDVAQGRTIVIDVSDIYTLLDRMASAKNELREHVKNYLSENGEESSEDNPVSIYLPGMKVHLPKNIGK
ncbi:hypothetical protein RYH70_05945 [Alloalcanivorax xenomutans]|uniref:hypothetical protein n=1 Tax=Alloalcanivorax xenomutans TaxID=1094342 RepID=UPI002934F96D|nr:hypothetical protein [Alloalcanivorax xenomutans]WOD29605.1 hypothetical protein RYH70_05945 [Alloalcanivorax xenomutans]